MVVLVVECRSLCSFPFYSPTGNKKHFVFILRLLLLDAVEEVDREPGNQAPQLVVCRDSLHGPSFSTSCLSISKDCAVKAFDTLVEQGLPEPVPYLGLCTAGGEDTVEVVLLNGPIGWVLEFYISTID